MKNEFYGLTNPQKSILLTEEFYKGTNINNICGTAIIDNVLDFDLLKKAMYIFINNHDSFHFKLALDNNELKQYLDDSPNSIDIEIVDIDSKNDISKIENTMLNHVFDIYNGDLFCMKIFRLKDSTGGFIVNVHHLFGDSWSLGILANDIVRIYSCLLNDEDVSKNEDFSYLNYINSEKEYLVSDKFKKDKEYWENIFDTVPELATIPGSIAEIKDDFSPEANRKLYNIDNNLMDKISAYCKLNHVSVFNFFMAVYAIYIGRVSRIDDFVLGTPILNRTNFNEKNTTGMFINTAPLRFLIDDNLDFKSFVSNIAKDSLGMLRHQKYYYQNILEDLRKKDASIPNLYNILISYQVTKAATEKGLNYSTRWNFNGNSNDDIDIHLFDLNDTGSINVAYDYRVSKYTDDDIEDMHNRILHIIWQILERENVCLKDIEIVTSKEKYDILYKFNDYDATYPYDATLVSLFEEQVEKTPDNVAVVFRDKSLTYKDLNEKANQLAHYLISSGIKKDTVIALRMPKSLEMVIGILAIIKVGACYLPINLGYPEERVKYMVADSGAKVLLFLNIADDMPFAIPKIDISLDNINIYTSDTSNCNIDISPEDSLYIIYTSGSTGKPKGALLCHRNVVRLIKNDSFQFDFNENDVWPMFHSVAFDVSVWEMYGTLLYGAKLILVPEDVAQDPAEFLNLLRKENVTILDQTPTYFYNLLAEELKRKDSNLKIRYIIFAGEALKPCLIKPWKDKYPFTKLINMYGITETTVHVTFKELSNEDLLLSKSNIGVPIPTLKMILLDDNLKLVPYNVPGEIGVIGDGVFKGYLNRPDLNSTKLIKNPYNPDEILYRSGDSAILHKDGSFEYCKRIDTQIKIRGFRVELGEIEEKILNFKNITSCVVAKKTDEFNHDILCAYYVKSGPVDINSLKLTLKKDLASYMIPQYFIDLPSLPYNHNGKINRDALPLPTICDEEKEIIAPRNDIDATLIDILKVLLHVNTISIDDSFLELGGDSLCAMNFCTMIYDKLGVQIYVKDVLSKPIILDLSNYIQSTQSKANNSYIEKVEKMDFYPLSSAQKRIYYASSLDANSTLYNIAGGIIVDKTLDTKLLQKCFQVLLDRHDVLRTHFKIKDNDIVQIIEDKIDFSLLTDSLDSNDLNSVYADFVKPFDLAKAPLFRAKAVFLPNNKMLLLLDMHHIISDGTSLGILLQELCDLYNGNVLPEKHIDYKDFTLWEKEQFEKDEFKDLQDFWVNQFCDEIPLLNMPTTYPRPSVQSFEGSNYYTNLPKDTFEKINNVAKNLGITPYMLMLSVYYILLSKYSSGDDILVGTPIIGRELPELSNMLGMFVNTLVLRNKVNHLASFNEFANSIKEHCLACFQNQAYPFDKLVKELNIKRDTSRNPLFDVMFIYQNNGYPVIDFKDAHTEYFIPDSKISKFDLSLEVVPTDNEFLLRFEYCTKLFDEDFIKRLSSHYINILNTVLENNEIKIADIDMLSNEERNQILYDFNNTKMDYPSNKTIVDLFEEQVEKTPDNIAVVFEDKKLTYRELNEKANQLARFLLANSVNTNDIVCLLLDKSLESIISIIATLKVGATYLPIDVNYPSDRIDYIIRDSKSKILLTTKANIHKSNGTIQALCIDIDSPIYSQNDFENIYCKNISADNLAYIMYTSGSTGNPKGVMVKHRNIIRLVKNNNFITFDKKERILQTGSIVFDACTFEIFGTLLNGFELYIIKKEALLDSQLLQDYVINNKITILWLTAPLFNQLCEENPHMFRSVKTLLTGGDVLSPKHINMVKVANPNLTVINGYGPTENTTFSCCFTIDKKYTNSIPIGKPISNSTAYVVSTTGNLNPIGVPGELWVGGDGVAKGYLNNDNLTNEKFIENPFGTGLVYKTGDLVKWLPNGCIDFIGRIDNQVKIRGFRVEIGEVNARIATFPSMKECFTIVNEIKGEKNICSYIVADKQIDIHELKQYLKRNLPIYMIPTYFMQLEKLPINTNGKVDRKSLPTNFKSNHIKGKIKQPTNENEKLLLDIFKKLLSFDDIGIDDDFFELGGNSLLAIKLQVEAISNNLQITYADIFDHPTVQELAKCINHTTDSYTENNFDYEKYNTILENNQITTDMEIQNTPIGNVLLTGFTGFLGAHVLDSYLKKENGTIYCLIRGKNNMSPEDRLKNVLHFYFDTQYDSYIGNRIKLVEGDITLNDFGLNMIDYNVLGTNVNTVIHCAALVKHYGSYNDFEKINIIGTKRVIDFCKVYNLKLLHVSTISVSGNNLAEGANIDNNFEKDMFFNETNFYIGQNLKNFYVRSKFEAEKLVLDAILGGLQACILRMGNLTSRFSEGKFQQNHFENAFVNRLKSFLQIGVFPKSLLNLYCEFTPIDYCGNAIIDIANHINKDFTVFHLLNEKHVYLDRLFNMLHEIGINISLIPDEEFSNTIQALLQDSSKKQELEGIINDLNADKKLVYKSQVNIQSNFTKEFLLKIGFEWPYIDINYIRNYFKYLTDIGYFNLYIN